MLSVPLNHEKHLDDIGRKEMTHHTIAPSFIHQINNKKNRSSFCFNVSGIEANSPHQRPAAHRKIENKMNEYIR